MWGHHNPLKDYRVDIWLGKSQVDFKPEELKLCGILIEVCSHRNAKH